MSSFFDRKVANTYTNYPVKESAELMQFLMNSISGISRTRAKELLSQRMVYVNKEIITQYNYPLKPGQLVQISSIIAELGGNVIGVHHERSNANLAITGCFIRISLETRNFEHVEQIKKAIKDAGFTIWD